MRFPLSVAAVYPLPLWGLWNLVYLPTPKMDSFQHIIIIITIIIIIIIAFIIIIIIIINN